MLACRGRMRTIMVTGDHFLTATAVAQVTGMLNSKRKHVLIAQPDAVFIHETTAYLPSVSSIEPMPTKPVDRYGQPLRTKSAGPDMAALADFARHSSSSSSTVRTQSLSQLDLTGPKYVLSNSPRGQFSSRPLIPKPTLLSSIPETQQATAAGSALLTQKDTKSSQQPPKTTTQPVALFRQTPSSQSKPVQTELASSSLAHARSSEPYFFDQLESDASSLLSNSINPDQATPPDAVNDRCFLQDALSFVLAEEGRLMPMAKRDAIALIAEGHQCIITGSVFEYMLQHADSAFLETVLRNVAVCARMKSHQKAQLVQLLGAHGVTYSSTRKFKVGVSLLLLSVGWGCSDDRFSMLHLLFIVQMCERHTHST